MCLCSGSRNTIVLYEKDLNLSACVFVAHCSRPVGCTFPMLDNQMQLKQSCRLLQATSRVSALLTLAGTQEHKVVQLTGHEIHAMYEANVWSSLKGSEHQGARQTRNEHTLHDLHGAADYATASSDSGRSCCPHSQNLGQFLKMSDWDTPMILRAQLRAAACTAGCAHCTHRQPRHCRGSTSCAGQIKPVRGKTGH